MNSSINALGWQRLMPAAIFLALVHFAPAVHAAHYEFTNNNGIEIRDGNSALPSPSIITVSGLPPLVTKSVKIRINGFTHGWPQDVDAVIKIASVPEPANVHAGTQPDVLQRIERLDGFFVVDDLDLTRHELLVGADFFSPHVRR